MAEDRGYIEDGRLPLEGATVGCHPLTVSAVTGKEGTGEELAAARARLVVMRRSLGTHLALYRQAAGLSQPQLAQALASTRTRSAVSKVESGDRGMPAALWTIADQVCGANGALIAEYTALVEAERDYRGRCRAQQQAARQAAAQTQLAALEPSPAPVSSAALLLSVPEGSDAWPQTALVHGQLAEELMTMITKLEPIVGRRRAMHLAGQILATLGLSGLDTDECTRVAHAVATPSRVDAHVVENLAATLAHCKKLEDKLGPCEIVDTIETQHHLVHRLLQGCPDRFIKPLTVLDSTIASTIGTCLVNIGCPRSAKGYFDHARRAGHDAGNPACAAYAAANASFAAFLLRDTPAALDTAAAARSMATRTHDYQLKALAEQMAAAAHALDGHYQPCMSATGRAHDLLTHTNGSAPESLAYWVHHGTIDSQRSLFLCLLNKPKNAVDAASTARDRFNRTFAGSYARCHIRLGHALALSKEIAEASRILADAVSQATHLGPRLITELHTARTLMQPWANTHAVKKLDAQLAACGLMPSQKD